jgi:hypothetical protein
VENFARTREGTVQGVTFCLCHPDLDPPGWGMEFLGNDTFPIRREGLPFLWYPWDGQFDLEELRQEFKDSSIKWHGHVSDNEVENDLALYIPEFIVRSGDIIEIDKVIIENISDSFAHEHDRQERRAFLKITRGKDISHLSTPILFVGVSTINYRRATDHLLLWEKLIDRIFDRFEINSIMDDLVLDVVQRDKRSLTYAESALRYLWRLCSDNDDLLQKRRNLEFCPEISTLSPSRLKSIKDAIAYYAKAEVDLNMRPMAEKGARSLNGAGVGGKASWGKSPIAGRRNLETSCPRNSIAREEF